MAFCQGIWLHDAREDVPKYFHPGKTTSPFPRLLKNIRDDDSQAEYVLRILIAAGLFSITAKYDNAVFAIATALSDLADVCVLSISRFPFPRLQLPHTTFSVVQPRVSWLLLLQCIRNYGDARSAVSRYATLHSWFGILSLVRYLINYSQLELTLSRYNPDVVHVHSSD